MIIKVMRNSNDFWMCDGVSTIDVSQIPESQEIDQKDPKVSKVALIFGERQQGYPGQSGKGMAITFFDKLGDRCKILFNTVAYICNDQGKTIETIFG